MNKRTLWSVSGFLLLFGMLYLVGCSGCSRSGSHQPRRARTTAPAPTTTVTDSLQRR